MLGWVQDWLADDRFAASRLIVVTRGAVAVSPGEPLTDLVGAAVWGLVKSAQSENPGRFLLVDTDGLADSWRALVALTGGEEPQEPQEPQLALRGGQVYIPRLVQGGPGVSRLFRQLEPIPGGWRSVQGQPRRALPARRAGGGAPLGPGQVRIAVRAAGLNFRDASSRWDVPRCASGGAGQRDRGCGPGERSRCHGSGAGDRVMGLVPGGFGPVVVADRWRLSRIPSGWSYTQAAGVPVAFLTALYGLRELGGLQAGERVLVHAAAGGVGMAAVQLARNCFGAEVYATASAPQAGVRGGPGRGPRPYRLLPRLWTSRGFPEGGRGPELVGRGVRGHLAGTGAEGAGSWRWARPTCAMPPRSLAEHPTCALPGVRPRRGGSGTDRHDAGRVDGDVRGREAHASPHGHCLGHTPGRGALR